MEKLQVSARVCASGLTVRRPHSLLCVLSVEVHCSFSAKHLRVCVYLYLIICIERTIMCEVDMRMCTYSHVCVVELDLSLISSYPIVMKTA